MRSLTFPSLALVAAALVAGAPVARAQDPAAVADAPALDPDAPLPTDPSLVTGTLPNGLRYIVQQHGNPEGHVSIWLHVHSGSLNETDAQRGIAHYLEHMAFNGSANFPPGSVVKFFESLGLSFGRDQNAFTNFEQTTYQLDLPDTSDEMLDRGMLFLSDVAFRLSLLEEEIESERGIIFEEKRTRSGAGQRIQERTLAELAPGSLLGERIPIGTDETLQSVMKPDFVAYYSKWYVPSNMTVIVVGDLETERVVAAIERGFSGGELVEAPTPVDPGVTAPTAPRAVVLTDPELTSASVSIITVEPARPPSVTIGEYRRDLMQYMAGWVFNRRLGTMVAEGRAPFLGASGGVGQSANAIRTAQVRASGNPAKWKEMLDVVAEEVQRMRLHGVTEQELGDARAAITAILDEAVESESTRPARAVLNGINRGVASGDPIVGAMQEKEIATQLMAGFTADEVSGLCAEIFHHPNPLFILTMPEGEGVPGEADLLAAGMAALSVEPEATHETDRATALMDTIPTPGTILPPAPDSGVTSVWFENGVRMHHRFMDVRKDQVTIAMTLPGGEIEETAENRGITSAASIALNRQATSKLTSTQIRDLMTGKNVGVGGGAGDDAISLTVSGSPKDLESGLQLAHLLLTDPVLEQAALDQWKQAMEQGIASRKVNPNGVMQEALAQALYGPGAIRQQPLEMAQVEAIKLEAAQAWLTRIMTKAPIEVSVVGDLPLERAQALVATYLGSLPARPRIHSGMFSELRHMERPAGPIRVSRTVATTTPQAVVVAGFYSTDRDNLDDVRALFLASQILSTRMLDTIREEKRLVYSIGAGSSPGEVYPGFGIFAAQAPTDPAKAEELVVALDETWDAFAEGGPTETEMATVRSQIKNMLDTAFLQPNFWIGRLASQNFRGYDLEEVMTMKDAYQGITAEEIRAAFARYSGAENRFSVIVKPE